MSRQFPQILSLQKMLKPLLVTTCGFLFTAGVTVNAAQSNFSRSEKELKIMNTIFETSLKTQTNQKNRFPFRKADAIYLANQGMVFSFSFARNTFATTGDWGSFGEDLGQFVGNVAGEIAGEMSAALSEEFGGVPMPDAPQMVDDLDGSLRDYEEQMELLAEMRESQEHQREEVRELQREIRRLERDKDYGNQNNNDNKNEQKLKEKLESKVVKLEEKLSAYKQSMAEYRQQRDKKYSENAQNKSNIIISTLCDYGATLRSLKSNEHVTLIFKNYNDNKDLVYVFKYDDVADCQSKDKLLKSAISYKL